MTRIRSYQSLILCFLVLGLAVPAVVNAQNIISTKAGGGATPTTPLTANIPGPTAAIKDAAGNLYIAAPFSNFVFKLNAAGTLSNYAGKGWGGFTGDGNSPSRRTTVRRVTASTFGTADNNARV